MSYSITTSNNATSYLVPDGRLNSDTSLDFIGKGTTAYGTSLNSNFLHLLESFAAPTPPARSIAGQIWFDTSTGYLKVSNGLGFNYVTGPIDFIDHSTIGNILLQSSSITGTLTNANVNITPNGTGSTVIKNIASNNFTVGRVPYIAANGALVTNAMSYNVVTDTLAAAYLTAGSGISGLLTTAAQTNITSLGTLNTLAVNSASAISLTSANTNVVGNATVSANLGVSGTGNFAGTVNAATVLATSIGNSTTVMTAATFTGTHNGTHNGALNGAHNGTVGATTANTGNFTTITASTISTTGGLSGVATNFNTNPASIDTGRIFAIYNTNYMPGASYSSSDSRIFDFGVTTGNIAYLRTSGTNGFQILSGGSGTSFNNSILPTTTATYNLGSSSATWATIYGLATSAKYADLAENYVADDDYEPGTVVIFGGDQEVTVCDKDASNAIAGVISTEPGYLMNAAINVPHVATVALVGRVPTKVKGPIKKGQMLVGTADGMARAEDNPKMGTVIGKALKDFNGDVGVIEVVVGRL